MTRFCVKVTGKVQGVYFRKYTKEEADRLGLNGFVRNEPDGSVYIEVEGTQEQLETFMDWCRKGSPSSKVEKIETEKGEPKHFSGFRIDR